MLDGIGYVTRFDHTPSDAVCFTSRRDGTTPATIGRLPYRTAGAVGLRVRGASARFQYLFVVAGP